jgi:sterol desaturase/sphingolipid hydroxylase (fatty acid hydroxylase superfamily)
MTLANTVLPLIPLFLVFDFWYTLLHWALHIKAIYGCIHKHHHHQKAPSRANIDAVNVHPIEYLLGEYNHLWTLHLVGSVVPVHIAAALLFLVVGGVLAGLNHTRFDVQWSVAGVTVYDSKVHDVHHRVPQSNYGQYTMFWDRLFGSFRPYNPSDRVNPDAQLDPKTGKTVHHQRPSKQEKAQ